MKFTKEQAFENLKSFLSNNGKKPLRMTEKSINAQLDTLIPLLATDEMELNDFIEKVKSTFSTMNSNAEHDNAEFIKQWNEQHPTPPAPPAPPTTPPATPPSQPTAEMQALMDRLAALEAENQENKDKADIAVVRANLIAKLKEKGVKDAEWIDSMLGEINIAKDTDVETKAESLLKIYNKSNSSSPSTTPQQPTTPPADNNPFAQASAIKKAEREAREQIV